MEEECNAPAAALLLRLTAATLHMLRSVDLIDSLPAPPAPRSAPRRRRPRTAMAPAAPAAGAAWEDARSAGAATVPNRAAQLFAALADALERAAWVMDVADLDDVRERAGGERDMRAAVARHACARLRQASADLRACASGGPAAHVVAALADDLERLANGGRMSDPTAVRRAVAIALTEGAPAPAAAAGTLEAAAAVRRGGAAAAPPCAAGTGAAGADQAAAPDTTAPALRMPAQAARSGADAAQARDGGAPLTDPTVQHAAVAIARRAPAWQKAMRVRAAALHAPAPSVPDAWTAPTDRASDAAAWPR